jgi:hypothetical protein
MSTASINVIWKDKEFICEVSLVLRAALSYTLLTDCILLMQMHCVS